MTFFTKYAEEKKAQAQAGKPTQQNRKRPNTGGQRRSGGGGYGGGGSGPKPLLSMSPAGRSYGRGKKNKIPQVYNKIENEKLYHNVSFMRQMWRLLT
jgi:hypothetical protein